MGGGEGKDGRMERCMERTRHYKWRGLRADDKLSVLMDCKLNART